MLGEGTAKLSLIITIEFDVCHGQFTYRTEAKYTEDFSVDQMAEILEEQGWVEFRTGLAVQCVCPACAREIASGWRLD